MNSLHSRLACACVTLALFACASPEGSGNGSAPVSSGAGPTGAREGKVYGWSAAMEAKRVALERAVVGTGISVFRTSDNQIQVNVPSEFSFDTDSAAIKSGMRPVLDHFAADLNIPLLARGVVRVVGHTDSRGTDAVNDALSLARASSVGRYLESKGVATGRIAVEGRGERQPQVDSTKDYALALNRRVEIFLRESAD